MDVMAFFELSTGKWRSQRTTHHLAFRRAEAGESEIYVKALPAEDASVIEICHLHQVDPRTAIGGAFVSWSSSMAWDQDDDNHEGTTVFALIPDADNPRQGTLLRERGYAEVIPVAGQYYMDDEDALVLTTEYETMSSIERFWFPNPSLRMRTSTVKRFGGFSTATFCTEWRIETDAALPSSRPAAGDAPASPPPPTSPSIPYLSFLGW
ncbi:phycobiliprotein lyase [Trichothermofontia sichuanensis B231]|uniref:phycobiliprotein lyase n=1 Tax=Trichothermofontia sichuanensis TaxID=3045816 RepID=UPI0022473777|nr:phycobiliprotein lyase [Trichothermofontia sichuanensis]UZQ54867.1 phycobiliprotein lyase [Trichothermofontia sichuanensis B231]